MLNSIAMMLLLGMFMGWICKKIHLPSLLGMILTGILLGPYVGNFIDGSILNISADLRKIALIIILTRAGLSLDLNDLKKVGRPAVLMCFVPACFEMAGMVLFGTKIIGDFRNRCGDHGSGSGCGLSSRDCPENVETYGRRVWSKA